MVLSRFYLRIINLVSNLAENWYYHWFLLTSRGMVGEMEESKFYRFCRMQNLRIAVEKNQLPDGAHDIIPIFNKSYHGHNRGTLQDEMGRQEPQKLKLREKNSPPDKIVLKFIETWVRQKKGYSGKFPLKLEIIPRENRFGQRFEPQVPGNNRVVFTESPTSGLSTTAVGLGTILGIFLHHGEAHFVVQQFRELTGDDAVCDPFRSLPSAGYLVCDGYENDWKVVPFSSIRSHFAKTRLPKTVSKDLGIQLPVFHALPLLG